jgi:hypothetical protein
VLNAQPANRIGPETVERTTVDDKVNLLSIVPRQVNK